MAKFSLTVHNFSAMTTRDRGRGIEMEATGGYAIRDVDGTTSITCLVCGRTSYHPEDVRQRYCGYCHKFHEERTVHEVGG